MSDSNKDFSPEAVMRSVATELHYNFDDLEVVWDETASPRVSYIIRGKSNKMVLSVFRGVPEIEADCQADIHRMIFGGSFFEEYKGDRNVLEAVAKVCNLVDLTPYLTVAVREGWVLPNDKSDDRGRLDEATMTARTISQIKDNQAALLSRWLRDPVSAVWRLHSGDFSSTIAVLIEQCSFDVSVLTKAIMDAMGGWKLFEGGGVVGVTNEGYVVIPENLEAREYMDEMYASSFAGEIFSTAD
jgi:hypothetical protein